MSEEVTTHWMTVGELQKALTLALVKGVYDPNAIFVVSKDPEGNGFLAFESFIEETETTQEFQAAPSWIEEDARGWRSKLSETETDKPCIVLMAMHEIDPEF